jgi:hypothetical protein
VILFILHITHASPSLCLYMKVITITFKGRRGRDRMVHVVGFTTTYAISAYHH